MKSDPTVTPEPTVFPPVVTREVWNARRIELLAKEKELTRQKDALHAELRRLPMVKLDKDYTFEGENGPCELIDLFDGLRQLIVYHFMFDPDDAPEGKNPGAAPWAVGCTGCSFFTDNVPALHHLRQRNTNLVLVSRARQEKIQPFKKRMGWTLPWYSSFGSDFNYDFHATIDESVAPIEYNYLDRDAWQKKGVLEHIKGELPALSVFTRDDHGNIYHTYSTFSRGLEIALNTYHLLDITPFGRQEPFEDSPEGWPKTPKGKSWMKHHDKYDNDPGTNTCCH